MSDYTNFIFERRRETSVPHIVAAPVSPLRPSVRPSDNVSDKNTVAVLVLFTFGFGDLSQCVHQIVDRFHWAFERVVGARETLTSRRRTVRVADDSGP